MKWTLKDLSRLSIVPVIFIILMTHSIVSLSIVSMSVFTELELKQKEG